MNTYTIQLDPRFPDCTLTAYLHEPDGMRRQAVIICPGGAYLFLSDREGEPVARAYNDAGLQAFVLNYSVGDRATGGVPLIEGALAIRYVRAHAKEWGIDPDAVFICGFSAGGHLAAMCGTLWADEQVQTALKTDLDGNIPPGDGPVSDGKPTATILGYPVISAHTPAADPWLSTSIAVMCGVEDYRGAGDRPWHPDTDRYSLELHVDTTTAPAFIWHTADDDSVPIESTLVYATALSRAGVPFEYHVYPHGPHGLSLATAETAGGNPAYVWPEVARWLCDSVRFMKSLRA